MKRFFRAVSHDIGRKTYLHTYGRPGENSVATFSPRNSVAFSALSIVIWAREKFRVLRRLTRRRNPLNTAIRTSILTMLAALSWSSALRAQLIDNTQATNTAKAGINKSLQDEIGAGRGDVFTNNSSLYLINRDPFRSIRRGRQLFQRKFTHEQGQGPNEGDGVGDLNTDIAIGAGLSDSCASCHGRPGAQPEPAETSTPGRIVATLRIYSDSA